MQKKFLSPIIILVMSIMYIPTLDSFAQEENVESIREEIKSIPKEEYGEEPASPCRDKKSPAGEGYYMVGAGLIGKHDLAIAVYNARNYCSFRFEGLNEKFCSTGVEMAIRNLPNLKKCYKAIFNKDVPIENVL